VSTVRCNCKFRVSRHDVSAAVSGCCRITAICCYGQRRQTQTFSTDISSVIYRLLIQSVMWHGQLWHWTDINNDPRSPYSLSTHFAINISTAVMKPFHWEVPRNCELLISKFGFYNSACCILNFKKRHSGISSLTLTFSVS
jgi:hypothetical protein